MRRWIAIGDSFTYLNDHPEEGGFRFTKGYLDRVLEQVPDLELINIGINGSTTALWPAVNLPAGDLYTILLGTNDWHQGLPVGTPEDFAAASGVTILGNLGIIVFIGNGRRLLKSLLNFYCKIFVIHRHHLSMKIIIKGGKRQVFYCIVSPIFLLQ